MKAVLCFKRMPYNQDRPFVRFHLDKGADFVNAFCFFIFLSEQKLIAFPV